MNINTDNAVQVQGIETAQKGQAIIITKPLKNGTSQMIKAKFVSLSADGLRVSYKNGSGSGRVSVKQAHIDRKAPKFDEALSSLKVMNDQIDKEDSKKIVAKNVSKITAKTDAKIAKAKKEVVKHADKTKLFREIMSFDADRRAQLVKEQYPKFSAKQRAEMCDQFLVNKSSRPIKAVNEKETLVFPSAAAVKAVGMTHSGIFKMLRDEFKSGNEAHGFKWSLLKGNELKAYLKARA